MFTVDHRYRLITTCPSRGSSCLRLRITHSCQTRCVLQANAAVAMCQSCTCTFSGLVDNQQIASSTPTNLRSTPGTPDCLVLEARVVHSTKLCRATRQIVGHRADLRGSPLILFRCHRSSLESCIRRKQRSSNTSLRIAEPSASDAPTQHHHYQHHQHQQQQQQIATVIRRSLLTRRVATVARFAAGIT